MTATDANKLSNERVSRVEYILNKIRKSASEGFKGVVLGEYIHADDKKALESLGYGVKTYYDGIEFEESTITWEK